MPRFNFFREKSCNTVPQREREREKKRAGEGGRKRERERDISKLQHSMSRIPSKKLVSSSTVEWARVEMKPKYVMYPSNMYRTQARRPDASQLLHTE